MPRLLRLEEFRECGIPADDPLRWCYHPVLGAFYRRRLDVGLRLAGSGRRVLELGYGSGTNFLGLADRFRRIHALDTHCYGSRIAGVFLRHDVRVRVVQGSVLALPYAKETFDVVLAISVLEHLHPGEQDQVIGEAARVLQPGGVLVVGVPGLNRLMSAAFWMMGCTIGEHHFSSPRVVFEAAAKRFAIDRVVKQPPSAPTWALTYQWFRGLKR